MPGGLPRGGISAIDADHPDDPKHWLTLGACRGSDPELWHPTQHDVETRDMAIAVCLTCVVRPRCRQWALDNDEFRGIWGGLTARARVRTRREAKQ